MTPNPQPKPLPETERRFKTSSRIAVVLFTVAVLLGTLYFAMGTPLRRARDFWRSGKNAAALETLQRWSRFHLRPAEFDHMTAVALLTAGRKDEASPLLERLAKRGREWFPIVAKDEVARSLVTSGRYEEFLLYDSASPAAADDEVLLYRAASLAATGKYNEADATFTSVDEDDVDAAKYASLKNAIQQRKQGVVPLISDREGKTLAVYQLANRDLVPVNTFFSTVIDRSGGATSIEAQLDPKQAGSTIETTLDPFIQSAAVAAIGSLRGSLVAIDPRTNEILAIASAPGTEPASNLALEKQYEPGSPIKVLTALRAIDQGIDVGRMFPANCEGITLINAKQFFDWARHDQLETLDEALAVSCNIVFAQMGVKLGSDRVARMLQDAWFGRTVDLGLVQAKLGSPVGAPVNDHDVATAAVGLQFESTNALHLAMLASMMANKGLLTTPKLIKSRKSILGEEAPADVRQQQARFASEAAVAKLLGPMEAVITDPRGTGRRAMVPGLGIAMKTGTSGNGKEGYEAIIMAFAPARDPKIAIAFIGENAGPAEFAGARVANDFFSRIAARLK